MKHTIIATARYGLSASFLIGTISVLFILLFSSLETVLVVWRAKQMQPSSYHLSFIITALSTDAFAPFVPIIAVLPFSGNYVAEVKSKFARFAMLRISYSTYLLSRIVACFLLGGAVILAGVLTAYFVSVLIFLPMEKAADNEVSQFPVFIEQCICLFVNGGLWAVLGMTMSTVMESKYIAYASPFVVYYLLVMLCERYFPKAYLIYPREWLNPSEKWPMGTLGVAIFLLELTTLLGLVFYRRGKRRLEQL